MSKNKISKKNRPFNSGLFDGIAEIVKKNEALKAVKAPAPASPPPPPKEESDAELWAAVSSGVRQLKKGVNRVSAAPMSNINPSFVSDDADVMAELQELVNGEVPFYFDNSDEYQAGHIAGVDDKTLKALKKGEFPHSAHLDLHGLTAEEAKKCLKRFLIQSRQNGHRCVLVITGRGLGSPDKIPVLRSAFPGWVSSGSMGKIVMAYCTALPKDGGPGAFYILLRKNGQRPFIPLNREESAESREDFATLFGI